MAEEQKPVEALSTEAAPAAVTLPAPVEINPVEGTTITANVTTDDKPTEAVKAEDKVEEEAKPVEEGHLSYKAQGLSFPK